MVLLKTAIFTYSLFYIVDTAIGEFNVKHIKKCSIKDDNCLKLLYARLIQKYTKTGIPELEIPSLDPMELKNVTLPILDNILSFTIENGVIEGIRDCIFDNFHIDVEEKTSSLEQTCDVIVKGKMGLSGGGEALQGIFGKSSIVVQGKGQIKLDKISYKYTTPLILFKKDDGEVYLKLIIDNIKYFIKDVQKMSFTGNDFLLGDVDIGPIMVAYFNNNWRALVKNGGDQFLFKCIDQYLTHINKFFTNVPTSSFVTEDLTPYLQFLNY